MLNASKAAMIEPTRHPSPRGVLPSVERKGLRKIPDAFARLKATSVLVASNDQDDTACAHAAPLSAKARAESAIMVARMDPRS